MWSILLEILINLQEVSRTRLKSSLFNFQDVSGWIMQRTCNEKFPTYSYCDLSTNKIIQEQLVKKVYYFIVNFVMFFIPIIIFFICYSMIIAKLYCSSSPGERIGGLMLFTEITRKLLSIIRSDAPGQSQEESCQIGCSGYHYFRHVLVSTPGQ